MSMFIVVRNVRLACRSSATTGFSMGFPTVFFLAGIADLSLEDDTRVQDCTAALVPHGILTFVDESPCDASIELVVVLHDLDDRYIPTLLVAAVLTVGFDDLVHYVPLGDRRHCRQPPSSLGL